MQKTLMALLLVAPALAGCLSGDGSDDGTIDNGSNVGLNSGFQLPFHTVETHPDHNHSIAEHHDIANNMSLEAFLPLGEDGAPGSISEMHVAGDHVFQGVMGYGFQISDISDPTAPELVATYSMHDEGTDDEANEAIDTVFETGPDPVPGRPVNLPFEFYLADIKSDEAGDWLFVSLEGSTNPGVFVYDVRDKSDPQLAGFYPVPGAPPGTLLGCHMIEYALIDDQEYLFCVPLDDSVYVGLIQPPNDQGVREIQTITRWQPADVESSPNNFGSIQDDPQGLGDYSVLGGHQDMTWQKDPLTGDDMLSVSLWDLGWYWVDVSNPAAPMQTGFWKGDGSPDWGGKTHTMMMFESDGRRIAVGIPEVAVPPVVHILDVTDYADPEVLAHWNALPDWHGEDGRFSTHNFQIVDGKVYMTHYHGGTIVLDISTPELQRDPELVGSFMPFDRRPESYGDGCCGGSWDVLVSDGYTFTANKAGFFVVSLEGDPLGDEAHTGFA